MPQQTVLVIDDEENMRHMLKTMLEKTNYSVQCAGDGIEALQCMAETGFDYILCDIKMPRMDGMAFLEEAVKKHPEKTYIMMSAYGTVETALEAIKKGAYDYISKPFKPDEVFLTLRKAEERERLKKENLRLKIRINEIEKQYSFGNIIARSEVMAHVLELVKKVAEHKTTVLITGESGTGKELIARAVHSNSLRSAQPFISVNSGALPEGLLESELFGHVKGAFTGAIATHHGRFRVADGGTLFLDEVGNMSPAMQVKLLRVLQDGEFSPVGSSEVLTTDVRVITATNINLEEAMSRNEFREDLYYRLNVIEVHVPPLRHRTDDILPLAEHFLSRQMGYEKGPSCALSSTSAAILLSYQWPGNVRELENAMERAWVLCENSVILAKDLPRRMLPLHDRLPETSPSGNGIQLDSLLDNIQKHYIINALKQSKGNRTLAASLLGLKRTTLLARINSLGIVSDTDRN